MTFKSGYHIAFTTHYENNEYYDTKSGLRIWRVTKTRRTNGGYDLGKSKIQFFVEYREEQDDRKKSQKAETTGA